MRQARFWFKVEGHVEPVHVTVQVFRWWTAEGVAAWARTLLRRRIGNAPARLITGRYLPEAA